MLSKLLNYTPFRMVLILFGSFFILPTVAETPEEIMVSAANRLTNFKCELDKAGGLKLIFNEQSGGPGELILFNKWSIVGRETINDFKPGEFQKHDLPVAGVDWTERSISTSVLLEYTLDLASADGGQMGVADLRVCVTNNGKAPIALQWSQQIIGLPSQGKIFGPSVKDFYEMSENNVILGYRASGDAMTIPMATVFNPQFGVGFTIAASIDKPVPPFCFRYNSTNKETSVERTVVELAAGHSRTVRQFVVRHAGDWRPGLSFIREKNQPYFMYTNPKWLDMVGCFIFSNVGDADYCRQLAREGVKSLEIHWNYSNLGVYLPKEDPFIPVIDDKWVSIKRTTDPEVPPEDAPYEKIKEYLNKVSKPVGSAERVRNFIRELHKNGILAFIYFQPTEQWEFFCQTHYPEAMLRRPDGTPSLTWYDHVGVNCRIETRWGQNIISQLERILDMYPEVDGVFMDQSASDPGNNSVSIMTDRLARIVEARGKTCYWNGPYMVELIEHASGMLAEGGSTMAETIKFLTIGNKTCCGSSGNEVQYQRNLIHGLWPGAASQYYAEKFRYSDNLITSAPLDSARASWHENYMRLFELYHGKTWVLEPDPITLPDGAQGNIFQRPDGDILIPLIYPGRKIGDGIVSKNVRVKVRISGADKMKYAYLRIPDVNGQFKLEMSREGNELQITLPWVGSSGLVWLSAREQTARVMAGAPVNKTPIKAEESVDKEKMILSARIGMEMWVPTGVWFNSIETTAPKPHLPVRKVFINGHETGTLNGRNYRSWRRLTSGIGVNHAACNTLKLKDNELVIEPDNQEDFIMVRNLTLSIVFADGHMIQSETMNGPWSSCPNPNAIGTIGAPIRIKFDMKELY